jgi:hypothetical protein
MKTSPLTQLTTKLILNIAVRTEVMKGEDDKIESLAISSEEPIQFIRH